MKPTLQLVLAWACLGVGAMGCLECDDAPVGDLYCGRQGEAKAADGTVTAVFTLVNSYTEEWNARPNPDFGCHFRTTGEVLELVPDGQVCFVRAESYYGDRDFFSRSCVPPVGTWLMADGVKTRKVEVFADGRMRCSE
ncbi:MAG: hypothetical protein U0228_03625 [Myxococcaceae bacterium]